MRSSDAAKVAWSEVCPACKGAPGQGHRYDETCREEPPAASVCRCGHPRSEHRSEVLPFLICRHMDTRDGFDGGLAWKWGGVAEPCWCSNYEEKAAGPLSNGQRIAA